MDRSEKKSYGLRLRRWREDRHLDRAEVAAQIGVSEKTLQHAELGYQALGRAAQATLDRWMAGQADPGGGALAVADAAGAGWAGAAGPAGAGGVTVERIADLVEDAATLCGQARQVSELLRVPYRAALVSVIEMRLQHGGRENGDDKAGNNGRRADRAGAGSS